MSNEFIAVVQMLIQFAIIGVAYPAQILQSWKEPRGFSIPAHLLYSSGHIWCIVYYLSINDLGNTVVQLIGIACLAFNILVVCKNKQMHTIFNNIFRSQPHLS